MFENQSPNVAGDKTSRLTPGTGIKSAAPTGGLPAGGAAESPDKGTSGASGGAKAAASMMAHWANQEERPQTAGSPAFTTPATAERSVHKAGQNRGHVESFGTRDAAFVQPGTSWESVDGAWAQHGQGGSVPGQIKAAAVPGPGAESHTGKSLGVKESAAGTAKGSAQSGQDTANPTGKGVPGPGAVGPAPGSVPASGAHSAPGAEAGEKAAAPSSDKDQGSAAPTTDRHHGAASSSGGSSGDSSGGTKHSPAADPGFQAVKARAGSLAATQSAHAPAAAKAGEAEDAAASPPGELESQAQTNHLGVVEQAQPKPFSRQEFKAALLERIAQSVPNNLEEADNFKNNNRLGEVKSGLQQHVDKGKQESQSDIKQKIEQSPSTAGLTPRTPRTLAPPNLGSSVPSLGAAQATPKRRGESEISMQDGPRAIDQQLAAAQVTELQLQRSNESQFQAAMGAKQQLAHNSQTAPGEYRQTEQGTLTQAQAAAEGTAQAQTQGMQSQRGQALGQVTGQQGAAKSKDEQARAQVVAHIQQIFVASKQRVEQRLARIDGEVNQIFDQGAAAAKQDFEGYVDGRMRVYKDERYSGLLGAGRWIKDKLFDLPAEVNVFYQEGKQRYLARMDQVLERIASTVEMGLSEAKAEVGRGKQEVTKYVGSLPATLKQVGKEAQQQIQSQFDSLEQSIRDKHDQLIDTLAQKYCDNVKQLDERIGELKAQNQGLVSKAKEMVMGVIQTIKQMRDMLLGVLARAAAVIGKILADPIGFIGNLVAGAKAGFQKFVSNIGKHLQMGLIGWLTGQLGSAGITMPESFDLKGIFSLVTQVLGLTWQNIRSRAVKILGEKAVAVLEKASDIVLMLINGGPAALWEHVQGMVGDLKAMVLDQIKDFVIGQIIQAGVTWVLSLLNPASAFIKACKAIYDVIMFFVERAAQIADLVNAVLDSVEAVAGGNITAMADKIDGALSRALPVAIGFLASLLGLGGISEKIKSILQKVRAPIEKAIDAVINKAVSLVQKAGKWIGDKVGGGNKPKGADSRQPNFDHSGPDERTMEEKQTALKQAVAVADKLLEPKTASPQSVKDQLPAIKSQFRLTALELKKDDANKYHIHAAINPTLSGPQHTIGPAGSFRLAPGGLEQHEGDKILTGAEEKQVHLLTKHGPDVLEADMQSRLDEMKQRFIQARDTKIVYQNDRIAAAQDRKKQFGPATTPEKQQKIETQDRIITEAKKAIADYQAIKETDRNAVFEALNKWKVKPMPTKTVTKFKNLKVMEAALSLMLKHNQTKIDAAFIDAAAKPMPVGTALIISHSITQAINLGVGYELNAAMQPVKMSTPLRTVEGCLRVSGPFEYKIETAYCKP